MMIMSLTPEIRTALFWAESISNGDQYEVESVEERSYQHRDQTDTELPTGLVENQGNFIIISDATPVRESLFLFDHSKRYLLTGQYFRHTEACFANY